MAQSFTQELQKQIPFPFQLWSKAEFYPDTVPKSFGTALVYCSTPLLATTTLLNLHTQTPTSHYGLRNINSSTADLWLLPTQVKDTFANILKNPHCSAQKVHFVQTKYKSSPYEKLLVFSYKSQQTKNSISF